jgi:DNA mismatch repair ATPase MutS
MKAFLMYRDEDFDLERELPPNAGALAQDLELETLFDAMALGDTFLSSVARGAILSSLTDPAAIVYRQQVLADCLEQPAIVKEIYNITVEAIEAKRRIWGWGLSSPDGILHTSAQALELFLGFLKRLRIIADEHAGRFRSDGFARFFAMLTDELDEEYFQAVEHHLRELGFRRGVLISAELGKANKGVHYVLRRSPPQPSWLERIYRRSRSGYSFQIADRDDNGFKALSEVRGKGIKLVANALAQSADHILSFFSILRAELAFYVGSLNLHTRLAEKGEPTCFPVPIVPDRAAVFAEGLCDVCLTLNLEDRVVGNDLNAENKSLVMITGANQGGKSTFLRSVGLAQLMMQSGMFVAADSFKANVVDGVFTHYKREEDPTMKSGKLDEELSRMSDIVDTITPRSLLLCNESFAATNEREGSEIARQVVRALVDAGIRIFFVTHLFDLAQGLYLQELDTALFLRAERQPDARRTFRLVQGAPLPTSFGQDSYRRIFGLGPDHALASVEHVGP